MVSAYPYDKSSDEHGVLWANENESIVSARESYMKCTCGGPLEVSLVEAVAVLKCPLCGRGKLIPQAKPHEVFDYRARVSQVIGKEETEKKSKYEAD